MVVQEDLFPFMMMCVIILLTRLSQSRNHKKSCHLLLPFFPTTIVIFSISRWLQIFKKPWKDNTLSGPERFLFTAQNGIRKCMKERITRRHRIDSRKEEIFALFLLPTRSLYDDSIITSFWHPVDSVDSLLDFWSPLAVYSLRAPLTSWITGLPFETWIYNERNQNLSKINRILFLPLPFNIRCWMCIPMSCLLNCSWFSRGIVCWIHSFLEFLFPIRSLLYSFSFIIDCKAIIILFLFFSFLFRGILSPPTHFIYHAPCYRRYHC